MRWFRWREWASWPLGLVCGQESKQDDSMLQLWPGDVESRLYPVYSGDGGSDSVIIPFYRWNDREVTQLMGENQCSSHICLPSLHSPVVWHYTSDLRQVHVVFSSPSTLSLHWLFTWMKIWEQVTQGRVQGVMNTLPRAVNHYSLEPSWLHSHKTTSSSSAKKTLTLLSKHPVE